MEEKIKNLEENFYKDLLLAKTIVELENIRVKYLGRKSELLNLFSELKNLSKNDKVIYGKKLNSLKEKFINLLNEKIKNIPKEEDYIDLTLPSISPKRATLHILTIVTNKICNIFKELGFKIVEGDEIEDEWHNFSALNIPLEHPSRDAFDTFYLDIERDKNKLLLRSHTSPSQIRVMENYKVPFKVISPGRVYRPDKVDASHSFMFHQIEGFAVDKDLNFSHLKGVLLYFAKEFFSKDINLRFRPHFFPFTEPSAEVDISCFFCKNIQKEKCPVCKGKGFIEILGCGMIHPKVLENCKINSKKYKGFAFGMGVDRIAMLKYRIDDIRLFYENDIKFLEQF